MFDRLLRLILIVVNAFLGLTAIAGGIGLLANLNAPPVEQLAGSVFTDFTIPGLALLVVVGGGSLVTTWLLIRRHAYAPYASLLAGMVILAFEGVEVLVIGSPEGVARTLQVFYSGLGALIALGSVGLMTARPRPVAQA
jgi:hypothetical protein